MEQKTGLISVEGAAGQVGLLGIATGNEVQLDTLDAAALTPINLEDFPGNIADSCKARFPASRRAAHFATRM